jgi:N-acetylglutamate synthase-like GNAT family acetyltransferase
MVSRMAEKVHFLPVDLQVHRSQVFDLMVEYSEWMAKEIWEHFKIDILAVRGLSSIREYVASDFDRLIFKVSSRDLFYLVEIDGVIIGMGALDQIREKTGAIKRMYIRPAYRGKGIGKALLQQLLQKAKELEYHSIYLDSAKFMIAAYNLYRSFGFIECEEYPETEILPRARSHWLCMKKTLSDTTK